MSRDEFILLVFLLLVVGSVCATAFTYRYGMNRVSRASSEWVRAIGVTGVQGMIYPLLSMLLWLGTAFGLPTLIPTLATSAAWPFLIVGSIPIIFVLLVRYMIRFVAVIASPPDDAPPLLMVHQFFLYSTAAVVAMLMLSTLIQESAAPFFYNNDVVGVRYRGVGQSAICAGDESAEFRLSGSINEPITVAEVSIAILSVSGEQISEIELSSGNNRHTISDEATGNFDSFIAVPLPALTAGEYVYSHTSTDINRVDMPSVATNQLLIPFEVVSCH